MKLKQRKTKCAAEIMQIVKDRNYVERMGGENGILLKSLNDMSLGHDIPYTKELNWNKIDKMPSDRELAAKFSELKWIQSWQNRLSWLPWV